MRCLIVIALCFVLANATYRNKHRFNQLLNRYQNRYDNDDYTNRGLTGFDNEDDWTNRRHHNRYEQNENLLGSDDVDDYIADYVDEIRRERMFDRDQCPRDLENILGQDDEYETRDYGNRRERMFERDQSPRDFENMYGQEDEYETRDYENIRHRQNSYLDDEEPQHGSHLIKEVEDANVKLASRLYKQSKDERDDKNTVVSPLSIQLALAALNQGARGNTKRQIGRAIGGRLQKQERKQIFKTLIRHLKGLRRNDYSTRQHITKINPVTGIFVAQTTRAQHMFIQQVKTSLGATVKHCSFSHQPQQCRQMINRFVAQKTHHKITHIVPQDAITDNTKMILVNALELKATWGPQMRRHQTKEAKFHPLDTKKVKIVEVMETQGRFKYYEDELVKIVGVPTQEKELTFYAIVPKDKDGLTEVEKLHLQDSVELKKVLDTVDRRQHHVEVQLPKFQIKHKIDVRRTLRKQGVTDAFDPQRADFSGITGVSRFQHEETEDDYEQEQLRRYRRNPFLDTQMDTEYTTIGDDRTGHRETKLHLNKFIHQTTIKVTDNGITASSGSQAEEYEQDEDFEGMRHGRQGRRHHQFGTEELNYGRRSHRFEDEEMNSFEEMMGINRREHTGRNVVKANHAFAFVVKHNPTNQIILVGRVIDAAQKKTNGVHQTINTVDQL
jgi:serpin B